MKNYILAAVLLVGVAGCSKNGGDDPQPTTADPFLGHWQSQTLRSVTYDAAGKQLTDQNTTVDAQLDITATTITITSKVNGKTSTEVDPYTRSGESLTITPKNGTGGETYFARSLTSSSFTFEFAGPRNAGKGYYIQSQPYRR